MKNYDHELKEELAQYDEITKIIDKQFEETKINSAKSLHALKETNRDMWENASHAADDFDGAVGLSQFYEPLANTSFAVATNEKKIRLLEQFQQSAYFARIDFRAESDEPYEKYYLGRGTLFQEEKSEIAIYDWRSPIASLFYRFETGSAYYDAPCGRITGNVNLKRQYEIKHGTFVYFFDADVQIADEFLRRLLSGNASSKMKTIVETIQKDQDIAIRDMSHDLLMIQGIAGSGKTSVALHRVAYLKYQGHTRRLSASDILILSPNPLFEQYISNVLPALGEDEIKSVVFDDLISQSLHRELSFQSHWQQMEQLISCAVPYEKEIQKQAMAFKLSVSFGEILERYADSLPTTHISFQDIVYDGKTIFTQQYLKARLQQMSSTMPLAVKLNLLRQHIFDEIHQRRKERMPFLTRQARENPDHPFDWEEYARAISIAESTTLAKQVDEFVTLDSIALYKKLVHTESLFFSLSDGITLPDNILEILSYTQKHIEEAPLPNEDALAIFYLQMLLGVSKDGTENDKYIRQVVVDEAQDYYSLHFKILKRLFPNAQYTILGDINQTIEKQEDISFYDRVSTILQPVSSAYMVMHKSFRCTKDILTFSMQFLERGTHFESFNRSGDEPQIIKADNIAALDQKLLEEAAYSKSLGYESIGIVCKNTKVAEALFHRLQNKLELQLVSSDDVANLSGVFIIPITMSKGLEFDSVLIYGTDQNHYHSSDDKKLLYIACTRALHRLNLFYWGEKSPLILRR